MPHIIVEYSRNLEQGSDIPQLLVNLHEALIGQGIDKARIKTRAIALDNFVVGDAEINKGQMVHTTLLLLEGREMSVKKQYVAALSTAVRNAVKDKFPDCAVTLEVRDMVKETYIL